MDPSVRLIDVMIKICNLSTGSFTSIPLNKFTRNINVIGLLVRPGNGLLSFGFFENKDGVYTYFGTVVVFYFVVVFCFSDT